MGYDASKDSKSYGINEILFYILFFYLILDFPCSIFYWKFLYNPVTLQDVEYISIYVFNFLVCIGYNVNSRITSARCCNFIYPVVCSMNMSLSMYLYEYNESTKSNRDFRITSTPVSKLLCCSVTLAISISLLYGLLDISYTHTHVYSICL